MNPSYGIVLWVIIGALAGWLASKIMATDASQGGVMNVAIGILGAVVGGFFSRALFQDDPTNNGLLVSTAIAVAGACVVLFLWRQIKAQTNWSARRPSRW